MTRLSGKKTKRSVTFPALTGAMLGTLAASATQAAETVNPMAEVAVGNATWAAVFVVLVSGLTAWLLNYSAPKVRVIGTMLAALGCFALGAWFLFVIDTGFLEKPRPHQMPLDALKPALLWLQVLIAMAGGVALVAAALVQSKSQRILDLGTANEADRYGSVSRFLHWSIAILILTMIPLGVFTSIIPEEAWYRSGYYAAHQSIGMTILLLVVVRLVWNRKSQRPPLSASLQPWERRLSHKAHVILYVLMLGLPITGYIMTSFFGHSTMVFGIPLTPFLPENETFAMVFGMLHKYLLTYVLYIVLGAHILGALKHKFIDKKNDAMSRMVS